MRPKIWVLPVLACLGQACPEPDPRLLDSFQQTTREPAPAPAQLDTREPAHADGPSDAVAPAEDSRTVAMTAPADAAPAEVGTTAAIADTEELPEIPELPAPKRRETPRPELVPPPALVQGARKTEDGLPIIAEMKGGAVSVAIAYDARLDDPIARWGDCLSLVVRCRQSREGPILPCVEALRCSSGGDDAEAPCCPESCLGPFLERLKAGEDELGAFEATILKGECMPGLGGLRARSRVVFELELATPP